MYQSIIDYEVNNLVAISIDEFDHKLQSINCDQALLWLNNIWRQIVKDNLGKWKLASEAHSNFNLLKLSRTCSDWRVHATLNKWKNENSEIKRKHAMTNQRWRMKFICSCCCTNRKQSLLPVFFSALEKIPPRELKSKNFISEFSASFFNFISTLLSLSCNNCFNCTIMFPETSLQATAIMSTFRTNLWHKILPALCMS